MDKLAMAGMSDWFLEIAWSDLERKPFTKTFL